jgi:hypothetical protein
VSFSLKNVQFIVHDWVRPRQTEIRFSPISRPQSSTDQTQAAPQHRTSAHSQSPPQVPSTPQTTQVQTQPPHVSSAAIRSYLQTRRRYPLNITSDMHYSKSSNVLHALLELPGVKKEDVRIKLGTCYFNHVKFISVRAESFPVFDLPGFVESGTGTAAGGSGDQTQTQDPSSGAKPTSSSINPDLRERRFGLLQRVIQVPSTTKVRVSYFSKTPPPVYSALQNKLLFQSPSFLSVSSLSLWVT